MLRISRERFEPLDLDEIRRNHPLPAVVGAVVKLVRAGKEMKACCPFHADRSPSFTIYEGGQRWHCFGGCGGGDVFDFLARLHGVGLRDAAEMLTGGTAPTVYVPPLPVDDGPDRTEEARAIWAASSPASGTLAEAYLRSRALTLPIPDSVRFTSLRYGTRGWEHPVLVAAVTSVNNEVIGIQRTYLGADGLRKLDVEKRLRVDPSADVSDLRSTTGDEPTARRYKANDSSYQALGELLRQNTNGLLVHRDELMSLLRALDREDNSEARGFYLTGWNGSDSYVFDRIGRGTNLYVPSVTISLLGSTQPALLQGYVRGVVGGGATDDGLLQRFSMTVWPDMPRTWTEHDREPHPDHRKRAFDAFDYLDRIGPEHVGAQTDAFEKGNPFLRFDDAGQEIFRDWRKAHEARLRSDELHPALESHLAKYRKMVPSLALIHHLASAQTGPVGELSVLSALAWADFLESHAHRIFGASAAGAVDGAQAILRGLRSGKLEPRFSARDIQRRNWSPLGDDITKVKAALDLLDDHHWVRAIDVPTTTSGGRPTTIYTANPKGLSR